MTQNLDSSRSDECNCLECSERRYRAYVLEKERADSEAFKKIVDENTELFRSIWNWGDGDGGYVLGSIREAVTGRFFKQARPLDGYKKKKINNSLRRLVFERDEYKCKHCNTHLNLTVDHIHPEVAGGTLEMSNLQTLCKTCNLKKGSKVAK